MKHKSLPPGSDSDNRVTTKNGGYPNEYSPRESYDPGYVDTDYRTVEEEKSLHDYISIILRRKKTIALVAATVFIFTGIYTYTRPLIYQSKATLELEKESGMSLTNIGDAITGGLGGGTEAEVFATQIGIIKDRAVAQSLIKRMNLADSPEFHPEPGYISLAIGWVMGGIKSLFSSEPPAPPDPAAANEGLINGVIGRITASRDKQARLLIIGAEAYSPKYAQEMLQNVVDIFLEQNLNKRRRVQREAGQWLKNELEISEAKLLKSLAALVDFTTKHGVVSVDDSANHILTFFQKAAEGLVQTKQQRVQFEALEKQHGFSEAAAISGVKAADLEQLTGKLSLLESEYAQMSEIYSENYPKLILLKKQIHFLKDRIEKEQKKAVSSVIETAKKQEKLSQEAFDTAKKEAMDTKSLGVEYAILKKEAETNESIFKLLLTKSKELQLSTEIIGNNILAIVPPTLPIGPIKPKKSLNMAIGAMLGLVLGLLAAFTQERLDTSVQDSRDLEKIRLPNLGMIPNYDHIRKIEEGGSKKIGRKQKNKSKDKDKDEKRLPVELMACTNPASSLSEAFSVVRTSLSLTTALNICKTVMITSATPGEGKTFIAASLASVISNYGQKILVLEADLRKPRISKIFNEKHDLPGLSTLLTFPNIELKKCIRATSIANLFLMTSGPLPKDPARLLHSDRMKTLIQELADQFDLLIIDTPPVAGLPDARILASCVDGVIFVVRQGHASIDVIKSARSTLSKVAPNNILGAIFNNVGVSNSRYYSYGKYGKYGAYGAYGGYNQYYTYKYNRYYKSDGEKQA